MFDEFVNTQTIQASPLTVSLQPGTMCNSVAFFNLEQVQSLSIEVKDGVSGPVVYSKTFDLDDTIIVDWYMYFFEPNDLRSELVVTDLPPYIQGVITCSFTGSSVRVGNMVLGNVYRIGATQYGVSSGIRDYSSKVTNDFGITTFTQRAFSKRMDANIYINNSEESGVRMPNGKEVVVVNLRQFCKENGLSQGTFTTYKETKGYKLLYTIKKERTYTILNETTNETFITNNLKKFCKEHGAFSDAGLLTKYRNGRSYLNWKILNVDIKEVKKRYNLI
jgi:hypothetical protein